MTRSTFLLPVLIALLGAVGLFSALTGDGWRDWIGWVALAAPVAAVAWARIAQRC